MNNFKIKTQFKILNKNLPLLPMLVFFTILYIGLWIDYWYLLFFILVPFSFKKIKPNIWQIVICCLIGIIMITQIVLIKDFSLVNLIVNSFNKATNNIVRKSIFNYLSNQFGNEISDFIKLVLFNIKSPNTYIFYNQVVDLGIVWLLTSTGFHIALINKLIRKLCKNHKIVSYSINFSFTLIYSFLLNFSYGCLRILSQIFWLHILKKTNLSKFDKLGFIGLTIYIFNPSCFKSYSFILSFYACIAVYCITSFDFQSKILNSIAINLFLFIVMIPFMVKMNHKIAILSFLVALIFNYLFAFIFIYFILFSWIPFMGVVHRYVMYGVYFFIGNVSILGLFINSNDWHPVLEFTYYLTLTSISKTLYLLYTIKYNKTND